MNKTIIAWDLGLTKCAAAVVEYRSDAQFDVLKEVTIKLNTVNSLSELVAALEASLGMSLSDADAICIGAAGEYDGDMIFHVSPYPYPMHIAKIAKDQDWPKVAVVHDYTPIICATFTDYLKVSGNVKWLYHGEMDPAGRRVTLGLGTGLGLKDGILFPDGNFWLGTNEIGHIGICTPPEVQREYLDRHLALMHFLNDSAKTPIHKPLTFENVLSGRGLVHIYQFLTQTHEEIRPKEISQLMQEGKADETLKTFVWYLGLFIGTVQLAFMPSAGIFITGGLALKNLYLFDHPEFFQGIHASPAYQAERDKFPLGVMCNQNHAFLGGAYYASKRLLSTTNN